MTKIDTKVPQITMFDPKIITQHIQFPVYFDGFCYILDKKSHMVAQKYHNISRQTMQDFADSINSVYDELMLPNYEIDVSNLSNYLFSLDGKGMDIYIKLTKIISVRGWGKYQYEPNGEKIYENVGQFLTYCCNYGNFSVQFLK